MRPIVAIYQHLVSEGLGVLTATGPLHLTRQGAFVLRMAEANPVLPAPVLIGGHYSYGHEFDDGVEDYRIAYDTATGRWAIWTPTGTILYRRTGSGVTGTYNAVAPQTGAMTVTADKIRRNERDGNEQQLVVSEYHVLGSESANRFSRYFLQLDVYHPDRQVAETAAYALYCFYRQFAGRSSTVSALTLPGWQAQFASAQYYAVTGTLPETGGKCYVATTHLRLENVSPRES